MKHLARFLAACAVLSASALQLSAAELGEPAAPLDIAEWVKGDAVDLAAVKGKKIVVVEFWATWCGPCRTSIPHLTELQKKFKDRGVIFVGVSDETPSKVRPFVDNMGDQMDYTVAVDRNRKTSAGYMGAYGVNGIPHAFIVDKEGRVAWHGHPMAAMDKVLDRLAANTFDLTVEKKRDGAQRKLEDYFERAVRGDDDAALEPLGRELAALDKELGGIEPGETLDLAAVRKLARFQTVMRDYQRALFGGKDDAELEKLEQKARPLAPPEFNFAEFKAQFQLQRVYQEYYRAVTGSASSARIEELAKRLESIQSSDAEMLNEIAWTLLDDGRIKTRDLKLALKLAQAAVKACGGQDANVVDTYARALFDNGKVNDAIEQQKKAIELCDDSNRKPEFEQTLRRYQAKAPAR
jgi:thiol-disulfide isomerase/thioredoxin